MQAGVSILLNFEIVNFLNEILEFSKDACDGNTNLKLKLNATFIDFLKKLKGDSGNGLIRFKGNWIIEGIVSFGYLCGLQGWPAIYTRVDAYLIWIESHVKI